jgi:heme A synthase
MLLLAGLTALALLALAAPQRVAVRPSMMGAVLAVCGVLAFLTMLAGSYVGASGAGLACSTLPACDGGSWTGMAGAQAAQMLHRWAAAGFFGFATVAAYMAAFGTTARVRVATLFAYALVVLQVMLGMANVAWQLPTVLREAHAANACAAFVAFVAALVFAAVDGTVAFAPASRRAHALQPDAAERSAG